MDVRSNIAEMGHNQPPEPTPFELSKQAILDLVDEAILACDGQPMTTDGQAEYANNLLRSFQAEVKIADDHRKTEAKPFDDAKKEIQDRYNPLIQDGKGIAAKAIASIKAWMQPYLVAKAAAQEAAAAAARAEADAAARVALEAHRIADATNLSESTAAEALIDAAQDAQKAASRAEKATATVSGGIGRASGLRTSYKAEVADYKEFARWVWTHRTMDINEWLDDFAQQMASKGARDLPGVTVTEIKTVV